MTRELTSTVRPTGLRVAGFACVALGAVLAGVGATRGWASVGFTVDVERAADVPVNGIDVWEGKVVLLAGAASVLVLLAMRLAGSRGTRRGLAVLLIVLGAACFVLPVLDAVRATERFGGTNGKERLVEQTSIELGLPEDVVRDQLSEFFQAVERTIRVDVQPGVWVAAAGGLLLAAGGVLGLLWARRATAVVDR